jgi:hypothetical protein
LIEAAGAEEFPGMVMVHESLWFPIYDL